MEKIGLIAGSGALPVIFAQEARKRGESVVCFAIKGMASKELEGTCDKVHWVGAGEILKGLFLLAVERIKKITMLGKVEKSVIYKEAKNADKVFHAIKNTEDKRDYAILDKATAEFKKRGVEVISGIDYLSALLPRKGVITKRTPSDKEKEDMDFGLAAAKEIARLDIGQTIVVKDKAVIAVEAMEGTDETIKRASKLKIEGFSVIKVARPDQDMRWDVPVVGPDTIKLIAENKGSVLAMEEKKMFLVEKDMCKSIADDNSIVIAIV